MGFDLDSRSKFLSDRYHLDALIARTSHSKVYLARDLALKNRRCIIKQLYPDYCPVEKRQTIELAFRQEAEILKKLKHKHPQICQYYNYFCDRGHLYLVQEWIEGDSLVQTLRQGQKLSEYEIKTILLNLLSVIECIHSLEIVHNDINPDNIIIRPTDKLPVLIDFGIAREINLHQPQKIIAGTFGYMSPQQAMGGDSYSNDLYSLGLTAIHLLTGKSPQTTDFNSDRDNFWSREKTAFDPQLVAVIDRAISPYPDLRFTSAVEMRRALHSNKTISLRSSIKTNKLLPSKLKRAHFTIPPRVEKSQGFMSNVGGYLSADLTSKELYLLLSFIAISASLIVPYLIPPKYKPSEYLRQPPTIETPTESTDNNRPTAVETTNQQLKKVIFIPGTNADEVLQTLGEPVWRKPGFWADSIAWFYQGIVSPEFKIGYIFDRQSNLLRQAEMAVPLSTDLSTVKVVMNSFLATRSLPSYIHQGLLRVYQRQRKTYSFTKGNLRGIIQRDDSDRIYMAVWEASFHR